MQPKTKTALVPSLFLGLMLAAATAGTASATDQAPAANGSQTSSAADLFVGLQKFLSLPASERSQVNVYYILRIKNCDASQARATLNAGGQTIPLQIAADGRVTPLPTLDQLNHGATVTTDMPATCAVGPKVRVYSTQPAGKTYDAGSLAAGLKQGNAAMSKIAGPAAVFMQKLDRIYFVGAGSGAIETNGQSKPLSRSGPVAEAPAGTPYLSSADLAGASRITLTAAPSVVLFATPPN
jgi:hypothetical protein